MMTDADSQPLHLDGGKLLVIDADFAMIHLLPVEEGEAPWIEAFARHHDRVPISVRDDGATVRVAFSRDDGGPWPMWDGQPTRIVAHLPRRVRVRAHTNAGKLFAKGLSGEIELASDAGTIDLENVHGRLRVSTSAGRVDGIDVGGTLDVESNAGAVHLEVSHLDAGKHQVRTNVGATRVELARGMPVRIEARTTMGSSRIQFPSQRDAAAVLELSADLGAIKVRESSRVWVAPVIHHDVDTHAEPVAAGPFRTAAPPDPLATEEELEKVLARVASGELSPVAARELLRALGH